MQEQNRYKNILVIVVGLITLDWILQARDIHVPYLAKIGLLIGLVSLVSSAAAKGIDWLWMKLALALGWVNSRIILGIVYFLFLMPIAWISRLFTKDPLQLKGKDATTLYATRNHQYNKEDLENIW